MKPGFLNCTHFMAHRKISEILSDIYDHLKTYLTNYIKYIGYDGAEKFVKTTAYVLTNFIVAAVAGVFLNIVFLAVVFYFGYTYDAMPSAFLFIAVFYFLMALIFILFRNSLIKKPLQKQIIQYIFSETNADNKESER